MTTNKNNAIIFTVGEAWAKYAAKHNIKNPFDKKLELLEKYSRKLPDGSYTILMEDEYSEEDKELARQLESDKYAYMRARDRFQVEWITAHEGWETGYEYAVSWNNDWNDLLWFFEEKFKPCEFLECNIFCKNFENCVERGFIEWN